jgi:putative SOS response-associated peptidase YedK
MCGRFNVPIDEQELRDICDAAEESARKHGVQIEFHPGLIVPGNYAPVMVSDTQYAFMRFGFPGKKQGSRPMINARSETAAEKWTFRDAMKTSRCLIPAGSYYEPHDIGEKKKEQYLFFSPSHKIIYFAGIYHNNGFAILTREPGEEYAWVHSRMPVIVTRDYVRSWLCDGTDALNHAVVDMCFEKVS